MASAAEHVTDASHAEKGSDERVELAKHINTIDNLPDPDADLTEEERAIQVSLSHAMSQSHRTNTC